MIIDQFTPLLPKYNVEVNVQVKFLHAMFDTTIMVDLALEREDRARG
jgi:hypothetical protein